MTATLIKLFNSKMEHLLPFGADVPCLAVAVSGGSDSMALTLLAHDWCSDRNMRLIALTVDHNLRADSASEAAQVHSWLTRCGIEHHIVRREGEVPRSGIQQFARNARYGLLLEKCQSLKVSHLLLGHQLEDQLETLLMRLSKGSGLQGLTAMQVTVERDGINLLRPLLGTRRAELRAYLMNKGQVWVDDPSNVNPDFTRTHLGKSLASLSSLPGSDLSTISLSHARLQRADDALQQLSDELLAAKAVIDPLGFVRLDGNFYDNVPDEVCIRMLVKALQLVRGSGIRIKLSDIENLYRTIRKQEPFQGMTLAGCQIGLFRGDFILCREAGRDGLPHVMLTTADDSILWDNRFLVRDCGGGEALDQGCPVEIKPLGSKGWRKLIESGVVAELPDLPENVRKNIPALWNRDELLSIPLISAESFVMGIAKGRFEMVFMPKLGLE